MGARSVARRGCGNTKCEFVPLPTWERLLIAAISSVLVLYKPTFQAMGLSISENLFAARPYITGGLLVPIVAFAISLYAAYRTESDRWEGLIFQSIGTPGFILGMLFLASK